jgi:hypothetical protein
MALYIANCSKQAFELHFWVEGVKAPVKTKIKPGGQENIYSQGNRVDHERIVEQHKKYGLIPVNEIDRTKEFVGQCYQFDSPISHDRLLTTMKRNDAVLYEQSQERRKEAAAATDDLIRTAAQETGMTVDNFEVEIEEVEQPGVDQTVHEIITVGAGPSEPKRGRGRPRRN